MTARTCFVPAKALMNRVRGSNLRPVVAGAEHAGLRNQFGNLNDPPFRAPPRLMLHTAVSAPSGLRPEVVVHPDSNGIACGCCISCRVLRHCECVP
jgi:hypothetical protein